MSIKVVNIGNSVISLYTREKKPNKTLKNIVRYIIKVYAPAWFEIKTSSKLNDEAPETLFNIIL